MKKRVVKLKAKQPVPLVARVSWIEPIPTGGYFVSLWCPTGTGEPDWLAVHADVTLVPGHYSAIEKA
jgi:hypothetical protein